MDILQYTDMEPGKLRKAFDRVVEHLRAGDFRAAEVKKLKPTAYYRAKLSEADRLLFRFGIHDGKTCILLLELIAHHAYDKSRFLNGAPIDETKLELLASPEALPPEDALPLTYINPRARHFQVLDKILSFDDAQQDAFRLHPPFILIGSAGSGKTVLTLEKLKQLPGEVLYVTHSPFLAENSRNLYYAFNYDNPRQETSFLSFREFLETLHVPEGKPMTYRDFERWFARYRASSRIRDTHKLYEEINGVLTGSQIDRPILPLADYTGLGVRRSIFLPEERPAVYDIFERYRAHLSEAGFYDLNLVAHESLKLCTPRYDWIVVDEVQDLTNIQLHLVLKSLRQWDQFILCGDSNQIVHPNFFSWAAVKSMFYDQRLTRAPAEIIRILNANYRSSPQVTDVSNRLLLLKNARFGSIDRESNYLVTCNSTGVGAVELLQDDDKTLRELNDKTRRSTRHAVMVMRAEDKEAAGRWFQTPLIFSIQEAKGLEYDSIILLNFVSDSAAEFTEIASGVTADDLNKELKYARAKDKTDKSLEAYKFYVNALYVALTRAVQNVYLVEKNPRHHLLDLLGLNTRLDALKLSEQKSTEAEWKAEAHRLELQGKHEQAEQIRKTILTVQPVPWRVLTPATLEEIKKEALDPDHFNQQAKYLIFECAVIYDTPGIIEALVRLGYKPALRHFHAHNTAERPAVLKKLQRDIEEKNFLELRRKTGLYGVDFRSPLNQTPLMLAAQAGHAQVVDFLCSEGANPDLRDAWGRTPFHISLREAYLDKAYASQKLSTVYKQLAPTAIKVKIDGRLIKIDARHMAFFLIHSMLACSQSIWRWKIRFDLPAFETGDFIFALDHFPEHVIPGYRRRRAYITSVLAGHEVNRDLPSNMQLFVRIALGKYILNPTMEIQIDDQWINAYDLMHLAEFRQETENKPLQSYLAHIDKVRHRLEALRESKSEDDHGEKAEGSEDPKEFGHGGKSEARKLGVSPRSY